MATGTFPTNPTPPPVQAVLAPPTGYEQSVEEQLRRTRVQVKVVEIVSNTLMLIVGSLAFLLALAVVDHWVLAIGFWTRLLALAVLLGGAGWWFVVRILPLIIRRINPVYAAYTIEQAEPSLKNSLINFLLLHSHRGQVHDAVYHALGQRAAADLSHAPADNAVDHSNLIRLGYVLAGLLALGVVYKILSPKDPLQSVARVLAPWADIEKPSRVDILDVQPLDVSVFQGEQIEVSAMVRGIGSRDEARVLYSTLDGQVVEAPLKMELVTATSRYTATLPGDDRGVQASLQYKIIAGDAETRWYNVQVLPAPHVLVTKVLYEPPAYMRREAEETSRGDIAGTEGMKVTVFARANRDVESAHLEFDPVIQTDGRAAASGGGSNSVGIRKINGANVEISFYLQLSDDRKTPSHSSYCLTFTGRDGHSNRQPVVHTIDVKPDLAPLVEILTPTERKVQIPLNGKAEIEVRAIDHDFALSELRLVGIREGEDVLNETLLNSSEGRVGQLIAKFEFKPAKYDLKVGDIVEYWAIAADNRTAVKTESPEPNVTRSRPNYQIEITAAEDRGGKSPDADKGEGGDMNDEAEAGDEGASGDSSASQEGNSGEGSNKPENKPENGGEQNSEAGGQSGNAGSSSASQSEEGGNQKSSSKDGSSNGANSEDGGSDASDGASGSKSGEAGSNGQSQKSSDGSSGEENSTGSESSDGGGQRGAGQGQKHSQGQQGGQESQSSEPIANDGSQDGDVFERVEKFRNLREKLIDDARKQAQQSGNQSNQDQQADAGNDSSQGGQPGQQPGQNNAGEQSDGAPSGQKGQQPGDSQSGANSGGNQQGQKPQQGLSGNQEGGGAQGSQEPQAGTSSQDQGAGQSSGGEQQEKPENGAAGSQQENSGGGSEQGEKKPQSGGSDSQGGQPQGGQKPKDQQQQGGGEDGQQPMGGGQGDNDKSGAGEKTDGGGSPQSQAEKPEQKGQQQSGGGKQGGGQKEEDGGKSPSGSNKGSQSQGESGGDRKGGGQQGGGQGAQKPGQDSAGSGSSGEQGDGAANEPGSGQSGNSGGGDQVADSPTGRSGEQTGEGSSTGNSNGGQQEGGSQQGGSKPSDQSNSGEHSGTGTPSDGTPSSQDPTGQPNETSGQGTGRPTGGGKPGDRRPNDPIGPTVEPGGDKANLDYARKSTDMVLEYLKDQKQKPDPELLDKLGWTKDDLAKFVDRWQRMKDGASDVDAASEAARRLDDSLRSLGLRPPREALRSGETGSQQITGQRDAGTRTRPPKEYAEQYRAFSKFLKPADE